MQPNGNPTDWQQPKEQPAQAPYAAPPLETPQRPSVVTITPDTPAVVNAPLPVAPISALEEVPSAEDAAASQPTAPEEEPVRWQATEYIHHEKGPSWFVVFTIVVIVLIAVAVFWMQSLTFAILVPVMAAALLVYINRPPRIIDYTLSRQGLHINDRLYPFALFKGFGVIHDGLEYSVMLLPIQRFKPGVSVYFPEEAGEAIVDMLGSRLPMQELHLDMVDQIVRKLRI